MGHRPIILAEGPPKFYAKGGLFYVDVGIGEAPLLAFTPHDFLKAIEFARAEYVDWAGQQSTVRRRGKV